MTDLSDLIARVERATGADRELDGAIHNAMFGTAYVRSTGSVTGFMTSTTDNGNPMVYSYTASTDAALALVERLLPEMTWFAACQPDEAGLYSFDLRCGRLSSRLTTASAPTFPLAIILALLRALDQAERDKSTAGEPE